MLYIVENLSSAREFLTNFNHAVTITNAKGSTKYYGVMVINYMLKKLQAEFPQVVKIIIDVDDDFAAFCTAKKLQYQEITTSLIIKL
jgi:hypothetical protein